MKITWITAMAIVTERFTVVLEELYGKKYSTSQVSRMFDYARKESKYTWLSSKLQNERLALHFTYLKYNYNIPSTQIPFLQAESYSRGDPQLKIVLSNN